MKWCVSRSSETRPSGIPVSHFDIFSFRAFVNEDRRTFHNLPFLRYISSIHFNSRHLALRHAPRLLVSTLPDPPLSPSSLFHLLSFFHQHPRNAIQLQDGISVRRQASCPARVIRARRTRRRVALLRACSKACSIACALLEIRLFSKLSLRLTRRGGCA